MYVCMWEWMHVCMRVYKHASMCACVWRYVHTCIRTGVRTCNCESLHADVYMHTAQSQVQVVVRVQLRCMYVYVIVCTRTGCIAHGFLSHLSVHMHTRVCTCMYRYPIALPLTHKFATVYVCAQMHNFLLCVFTRVHMYLDWCTCRRQFAAPTHTFAFWAMSGMMTSLTSSRSPRGLEPRSLRCLQGLENRSLQGPGNRSEDLMISK